MSKESQSTFLIDSITFNIIDRDESISDYYHSIPSMNSRATNITCMYYSDYYADGGELHYRHRKQRPDKNFRADRIIGPGGPKI